MDAGFFFDGSEGRRRFWPRSMGARFEGSPFGNMISKPKVVGFTGIFLGRIGEK